LALGFFDVQRDVHVYVGLTGAFDDAVELARAAISVRNFQVFLGCHSVHKLQAVAKMVHQKRALLFSLRFPSPTGRLSPHLKARKYSHDALLFNWFIRKYA
jgi:hypothetical protein